MKRIPKTNQVDCRMCKLHRTRTNVVVSDGPVDHCNFVVVGEGPGADEDVTGTPFVGRSGQKLRAYCQKYAKLVLGRNAVVLNTVSCRPPANRVPTLDEKVTCERWLHRNLQLIKPRMVLLAGKTAAESFVDPEFIKLRGIILHSSQLLPQWKDLNFEAMHIFHPSYLLRNGANKELHAEWANQMVRFKRYAVEKGYL